MNLLKTSLAIFTSILLVSCNQQTKDNNINVDPILLKAEQQIALLLKASEEADEIPRTVTPEGTMHWTNKKFDWTEPCKLEKCSEKIPK